MPRSGFFFSGLIFFSVAGLNVTLGLAPMSHHLPNGRRRGPVPSPSQGRVRGPTGQAAPAPSHPVPPRHRARSAGNSPEPSGPRSARRRTERKPRGTVNSPAPGSRRPRRSPRPRQAPGPRTARTGYTGAPAAGLCAALPALHRDVGTQHGANGNAKPSASDPPAGTAPASSHPAKFTLPPVCPRPIPVSRNSGGHSPNGALTPSRSER